MDIIPRTRKEALKAGLRKFVPFKACKKGHLGEHHVVKGCLTCVRSKRQRQHTARILAGDWLDALERAIVEQREGTLRGSMTRAGVWFSHIDYMDPRQLALFIAHVITKPRPENKPPSLLTVAQDIGQLLEVKPPEKAEAIGAMLLGAAEECGFIEEMTPQERVQGRMPAREIRLSLEARLQRECIEARLAAADIPDARPVFDIPPAVITISRNPDDHEPAPLPQPEDMVAAALKPLQSTAWRVNQFIYKTLRAIAPLASFEPTEGKHIASLAALEQAGYMGERRFYYPCRFDWRGRIYQVGGRLQYTSGVDAARALLEFADGDRLDYMGRSYLALQVATCYGLKGSIMERGTWTREHTAEILQAAADPLNSLFWRKAKEPYQFLAACDAWRQAQDPDSIVHLPIAADATSSLLQHYALLMRDVDLAEKVNLIAREFDEPPEDFYGELSENTELTRPGVKEGAWLFYGQTKKSLARELLAGGHAPDWQNALATAKVIRDGMGAQAPGAIKLKQRLRQVARLMSPADAIPPRAATPKRKANPGRPARLEGFPITWLLPDHFRVSQANYKVESKKTSVTLLGTNGRPWELQSRRRVLTPVLDEDAQIRGLPANLIHSLDACLLRAVVREAPGIPRWACAHDCLGVHPNDGDRLREAAHRAMRWLYERDILEELWRHWGRIAGPGIKHPKELPAQLGVGWYTFS